MYGQTGPIEILGTFDMKITCDVTGVSCEDQFMVIKGKAMTLLSKGTAEKLNVLGVVPVRLWYIRSLLRELMRM